MLSAPLYCHTAFAGNDIGDSGCKVLGGALKENTTLRSINLGRMFGAPSWDESQPLTATQSPPKNGG